MRKTSLSNPIARALLGLLLAGWLGLPASAQEAVTSSPSRWLERLRSAYAAHEVSEPARFETGVVEIVSRPATGSGAAPVRWVGRLEWLRSGDDYRLTLHAKDPEPDRPPRAVLWRRGEGPVRFFEAERGARELRGPGSALSRFLPAGGLDALAPVALALGVDPFGEPEGLAFEPTPGGAPVLVVSRSGGAVESRLEIDPTDDRIRAVEVRQQAIDPFTGTPRGAVTTVRVTLDRAPVPEKSALAAALAFSPPPTREASDPAAADVPVFGETVEVRLLSVPVRVLDRAGRPVPDLGAEDFEVTVKPRRGPARQAEVTAVDYFAYQTPEEQLRADAAGRSPEPFAPNPIGMDPPPPRRTVVFFLQADKEGERVGGHLKMAPRVQALMDALPPGDRVAVLSFDSHLKLWVDATRDRRRAREALGVAWRFSAPEPLRRTSELGPLGRAWDGAAARRAATTEQALDVTASALEALEGTKELIFVGWGLGRFGKGGVRLQHGYDSALAKMGAGAVTVHVLDVSQADYHDLEFGLRRVAEDTGGFYFPTFRDAEGGIRGLTRALSGYYVLRFDQDALPGDGELRIRLAERRVGILHAPEVQLDTGE